jgi:hypothetical protein
MGLKVPAAVVAAILVTTVGGAAILGRLQPVPEAGTEQVRQASEAGALATKAIAEPQPAAQTKPARGVMKFSCTKRAVKKPLTPDLGGDALTADDELASFLSKFGGPGIVRKAIIYSPEQGWSIKNIYADGQVVDEGGGFADTYISSSKIGGKEFGNVKVGGQDGGGHFKLIDFSTPEKLRDEHILEWRATSDEVWKYVGKLRLEGKSKATYFEWNWWVIPRTCSLAAYRRFECPALNPTDEDLSTFDCVGG